MNCPYCGGEINTNYSTIPTTKQDQPLSPWAYFGYTLLFQLPVIGFICLIIFSLDNGNINRRNYARMFWIPIIISLVLSILLVILVVTGAISSSVVDDLTRY